MILLISCISPHIILSVKGFMGFHVILVGRGTLAVNSWPCLRYGFRKKTGPSIQMPQKRSGQGDATRKKLNSAMRDLSDMVFVDRMTSAWSQSWTPVSRATEYSDSHENLSKPRWPAVTCCEGKPHCRTCCAATLTRLRIRIAP